VTTAGSTPASSITDLAQQRVLVQRERRRAALAAFGRQLGNADDGRCTAQTRHGVPRRGRATVAVPGIRTSVAAPAEDIQIDQTSLVGRSLAGDDAPERQSSPG